MKILVFDTETTGLPEKNVSIYEHNKWPYILQLSYIFYDISNNISVIKDDYINKEDAILLNKFLDKVKSDLKKYRIEN